MIAKHPFILRGSCFCEKYYRCIQHRTHVSKLLYDKILERHVPERVRRDYLGEIIIIQQNWIKIVTKKTCSNVTELTRFQDFYHGTDKITRFLFLLEMIPPVYSHIDIHIWKVQ